MYLDDGLWETSSYRAASVSSAKVKENLAYSGFVPNSEKSLWFPTPVIDWLGFTIDLFQGLPFVPGKKLKRVLSDIVSIKETGHSTARELSAVAGRINYFNLAVGNVTNLMTKFLNMAIVLRSGWDVKLPLPPSVRGKLTFRKDNIRFINGRPIGQRFSAALSGVSCKRSTFAPLAFPDP